MDYFEVPAENYKDLPTGSWKVRACEEFKDEYNECRKIKVRFHQYFTKGELEDCSGWYDDYKRCLDYRRSGNIDSLQTLIEHEEERIKLRLSGHLANDIWEKREQKPPPNWNCEVPERLRNNSKILEEANVVAATPGLTSNTSCTIL